MRFYYHDNVSVYKNIYVKYLMELSSSSLFYYWVIEINWSSGIRILSEL